MRKASQIILSIFFLCMMITAPTVAQGEKEYTVAIFLYDGVELLDFSGPGEVFGATDGFDVYTVSTNGEEIISQGFVKVKPEYSIETAPEPDIVVFPGGGTSSVADDPELLGWIKQRTDDGMINMSVCTGARLLANAGVLDGLNVTTWHGFTERLQEMLPGSTVHEDTRFVDSGNILTTAGVSAGIDGALHMVARIKGHDVAKSTARYMEYDKWEPKDGMIDYENPLIEAIKNQGLDQALESVSIDFESRRPAFYEGEMKNPGFEYIENEQWSRAEEIFELVVKYYPYSISSYEALASVYEKRGKYVPLTQQQFIEKIMDGNIDEAISDFRAARKAYPGWVMFSEGYVNWAGYQYLQKDQFDDAIILFKLNVEVYPESANVYDSLGEAYMKSGQEDQAIKNYKKALEIDPELESAQNALSELGGSR